MDSTMKKLYQGEINLTEGQEQRLQDHRRLIARQGRVYDTFRAKLDAPMCEEFDRLTELHFEQLPYESQEGFIAGLSLGLRLMAEAYRERL